MAQSLRHEGFLHIHIACIKVPLSDIATYVLQSKLLQGATNDALYGSSIGLSSGILGVYTMARIYIHAKVVKTSCMSASLNS